MDGQHMSSENSWSSTKKRVLVGSAVNLFTLLCMGVLVPYDGQPVVPEQSASCLARPGVRCLGEMATELQVREPNQDRAAEMASLLARLGMDLHAQDIAKNLPARERADAMLTVLVGRIVAEARAHPIVAADLSALRGLDRDSELLARGRLAALLTGERHGEPLFIEYSIPDLNDIESTIVPPSRSRVSLPTLDAVIGTEALSPFAFRYGMPRLDLRGPRGHAMISIVRASRLLGISAPLATSTILAGGDALSLLMIAGLGEEALRANPTTAATIAPSNVAAALLTMPAIRNGREDVRRILASRALMTSSPMLTLRVMKLLSTNPSSPEAEIAIARARQMATSIGTNNGTSPMEVAAALVTVGLNEEARRVFDGSSLFKDVTGVDDIAMSIYVRRQLGRESDWGTLPAFLSPSARRSLTAQATFLIPPSSARDALINEEIAGLPANIARGGMRFQAGLDFVRSGERNEGLRQLTLAYRESQNEQGLPSAGFNTLLMTARTFLALGRPDEAAQAMRRAWLLLPRGGADVGIYMARYAVLWHERFTDFNPLSP